MIQYILGTFGVGAVNRWIGGQTAFTSYSCRGLGQSRPASDSIQYHNGFLLVRPLIKNSFFYPTSQDRLTLSVGLNPLPFAMRWIPISWHFAQELARNEMIRKTISPCDVYFHLNRNIGIPRGGKPYPPSFTSPLDEKPKVAINMAPRRA